MESFVKSLSEDMKQQDLDSNENQFVLALAGIVTSKLMLPQNSIPRVLGISIIALYVLQ